VRRDRGFTLIEVMIALVIFSMIMVATISALRTFGNTRLTVERLTGRVDELRLLSNFLRNTIGAALPVARYGDSFPAEANLGSHGVFFLGFPSEVIWVAPVMGGAGFGGAHILHLSLDNDQLVLRWHPYQTNVTGIDWGQLPRRVLLEDVERLILGYRTEPWLSEGGPVWVEEWTGAFSNPAAVRLSIKAAGRFWPEIVIRLDHGELNAR
jgi:general secretion pathway protein J